MPGSLLVGLDPANRPAALDWPPQRQTQAASTARLGRWMQPLRSAGRRESVRTRQILTTTPATNPGIVGGMIDHTPLPDFGDELGLYRLVRWAKARVRASAWPPVERAAILAEIGRQCRAARGWAQAPLRRLRRGRVAHNCQILRPLPHQATWPLQDRSALLHPLHLLKSATCTALTTPSKRLCRTPSHRRPL